MKKNSSILALILYCFPLFTNENLHRFEIEVPLISDATIMETILQNNFVNVFFVYITYNEVCERALTPMLFTYNQLSKNHNIKFWRTFANSGVSPLIATATIPTIIIIKNNAIAGTLTGYHDTETIINFILSFV